MPNAAPSIESSLVRQLIATQFPQWADLPIQPVEPGGWDNRTFRLGDHMSVRLPSAAAYAAQVEKEHRWLPALSKHLPLPIPAPIAMGVPTQAYPWHWSIYRWLEGESANMAPITDMGDFSRSLAGFLAALHQTDAFGGPPPGEHNFHRGGNLAVYDPDTRAALAALHGRLDTAAAEEVWTLALNSRWQGKPVWVHGDIAGGNLLVKNGSLCAVIDFGGLAVGDPACDLVIAWTQFSDKSRQIFRAALPFDEATWCRARGWALWKALITVAGRDQNQREAEKSWNVIAEVLADHRLRA